MDKPKSALNVSKLDYSFGPKFALKNINFSIGRGEFRVLLGSNGAGKTTLFSLITSLYASQYGQIKIGSFDLNNQASKALAQLGVVFQQPTLDLDLTVRQNLLYHSALHGLNRKHALQRIKIELQRLNMLERQNEKIRRLNGGHRRRVEIARALLHEPQLLLLDEPTVGLDVPTRHQIVDHVHKLVKETQIAVLWATHLVDEIYDDDHVMVINNGKIHADELASKIMAKAGEISMAATFNKLIGKTME